MQTKHIFAMVVLISFSSCLQAMIDHRPAVVEKPNDLEIMLRAIMQTNLAIFSGDKEGKHKKRILFSGKGRGLIAGSMPLCEAARMLHCISDEKLKELPLCVQEGFQRFLAYKDEPLFYSWDQIEELRSRFKKACEEKSDENADCDCSFEEDVAQTAAQMILKKSKAKLVLFDSVCDRVIQEAQKSGEDVEQFWMKKAYDTICNRSGYLDKLMSGDKYRIYEKVTHLAGEPVHLEGFRDFNDDLTVDD